MISSKEMPTTIGAILGMLALFFLLGAPFIFMNDMINFEMRGHNPGASFPETTYLKQDPRDAGGFWNALFPASESADAGPSEVQMNPYSSGPASVESAQ